MQLTVREAVSHDGAAESTTAFKRLLDDRDLHRLHQAGVIATPSNRDWFSGHLMGKAGARTTAPAWFGLHRVLDEHGSGVPAHADERLEVFHYESYSADEFARKWRTMVGSGPPASYRPGRAAQARRIRSIVTSGLPDEEVHARLVEEYHAHVADDVDALERLGVLVHTDPVAGTHEPRPDADVVSDLRASLARLRGVDKQRYFIGSSSR